MGECDPHSHSKEIDERAHSPCLLTLPMAILARLRCLVLNNTRLQRCGRCEKMRASCMQRITGLYPRLLRVCKIRCNRRPPNAEPCNRQSYHATLLCRTLRALCLLIIVFPLGASSTWVAATSTVLFHVSIPLNVYFLLFFMLLLALFILG